jgi:hypothetical protein
VPACVGSFRRVDPIPLVAANSSHEEEHDQRDNNRTYRLDACLYSDSMPI